MRTGFGTAAIVIALAVLWLVLGGGTAPSSLIACSAVAGALAAWAAIRDI